MKNYSSALIASLPVVAMLFSGPVLPADDEDEAEAALEEVIVTATRRVVNLQEVDLAISAFTAADLDRMGVNNIERLDLLTPGFEYGAFGAGNALTIRGLGRPNFEANTPGAVGVFVDGVYRSRGQQAWLAMLDSERVEITRGPQGTLYGRNTNGGNINIITNKPHDEFDFFGDVEFGNYNSITTRAMVNAPLSDTFQFRGSVLYEEHDGYIENSNSIGTDLLDEEQTYFQGALRWTPNEDVEIIARAHYWEQGGFGTAFSGHKLRNNPGELNSVVEFWNFVCDNVFFSPMVFDQPALIGTNACTPGRGTGIAANDLDPYNIDYDFPARRDVDESGFSLHIDWDLENIRLSSITSYTDYQQFSEGDVDFSAIPTWQALITQDLQAFSQEFHISSIGSEPLEWLLGFYYFDEDNKEIFSDTLTSFPEIFGPGALVDPRLAGIGSSVTTGFTLNFRDSKATTESTAIFGQASYSLSDQVRLTGGVRYTKDDIGYDQTDIDPGQRSLTNQSRTFKNTTWRAGIDYFWSDDNSLYFVASTGFKAGFFNRYTTILPGQTESVEPEEIDNYAIGSKNRFADDRVQINAEIFWNDITNAHTYTFDASVPTSVGTAAGKASTFGAEVELAASPSTELYFTATVAYLDAKYDVYPDFSDGAGIFVDVSGNYRERSPKWTASFTAAYDIDLGASGILTPYIQWAFKDEYFITALNDSFLDRQESFTQTDVRLGWASADGHWNADAFIQNIEDNGVLVGGFFAFGGMWLHSGPQPRTYGLRLGYSY